MHQPIARRVMKLISSRHLGPLRARPVCLELCASADLCDAQDAHGSQRLLGYIHIHTAIPRTQKVGSISNFDRQSNRLGRHMTASDSSRFISHPRLSKTAAGILMIELWDVMMKVYIVYNLIYVLCENM